MKGVPYHIHGASSESMGGWSWAIGGAIPPIDMGARVGRIPGGKAWGYQGVIVLFQGVIGVWAWC